MQGLEIGRDGTFRQTIGGDDAGVYVGYWSSESSASGLQVELMPYHFFWPSHLMKSGQTGFWVANARRLSGKVTLDISEDDSLYCEQLARR